MRSTRLEVIGVVGVAALGALVLEGLPAFRIGDPRAITAAAETAAGVVGLALIGLLVARVLRTRARSDLALGLAVALLTASVLLWSAVPHALELERGGVAGWASAACHALAAACLLLALRPRLRPIGPRVMIASGVFVVALEVLAVVAALTLAPGVPPPPALAAGARLALALVLAVVAVQASAPPGRDPFRRGLAVGSALAGCAFLSGGLHASLSAPGVGLGDLLRLAAFTALLQGCVLDLLGHWRGVAAEAVQEERRRLARDLHDGLAQELAALVRCGGDERAQATARRALHDVRAAIDALHAGGRPDGAEPLATLIARATQRAARRAGVEVSLVLDPAVGGTPRDRTELPMIASQAVDNAATHARAQRIEVRLQGDGHGPSLSVVDDGCGLSPDTLRAGHGLQGMAERAARAGRRLRVRSMRDHGTTVEVTSG